MEAIIKSISTYIGVIMGIGVISFPNGLITMLLWNWLGVTLFSLSPISFWAGYGIAFTVQFFGRIFHNGMTK